MKRKQLFLIILLPLLGVLMYASKEIMALLPNIHILAMLIVVYTAVFRWLALVPIYIFVFLSGLFGGFLPWWIPYLYVWTLLWAVIMLLSKNMKPRTAAIVYSVVASLHGFLFGVLYSPVQAIMFGLDFKGTLAWIAAGLPFDVIHGISNFITTSVAVIIINALKRAIKAQNR